MKLLVIGAGMMGSAAAYDLARAPEVEQVTLADCDRARAEQAARRVNQLGRTRKVHPQTVDAAQKRAVTALMRAHAATLSCVPYHFNLRLAEAAVAAGRHFADLGGNHTIVRQELALAREAAKKDMALAPDCGLSPGLASILGGELVRRLGGRADYVRIYVGGLPAQPKPPFRYQLVFSAEGLLNEYAEPCRILRGGKIAQVAPLTEPEVFTMAGFPPLEAFHTSGGTSTLPDTFRGRVGECFEKTLRYPGHHALLRGLSELGLFSQETITVGRESTPASQNRACRGPRRVDVRRFMTRIFEAKFAGDAPDLVILEVQARREQRAAAFTMVDHSDRATGMTAMMRTTAWPAAIVLRLLAGGIIPKRGAVYQELDVPFARLAQEMAARGVKIDYREQQN